MISEFSKKRTLLGLFFFSLILIVLIIKVIFGHGFTGALVQHPLILGIGLIIGVISIILILLYRPKSGFLKKISSEKYLLIGFVVLFSLGFALVSYSKYLNLSANLYDFALEQQVVWNTSEGRFFAASVEVPNYLGDHFSPITVFPALVYKVFPGPFTLFFLQALAVAIAALGVYYLAKKFLKNKYFPWILMIAFAFYQPLSANMLFDYHPITFALPLLIWGIYCLETKKSYFLTFLLFLLAGLCKEDVGIFVGMVGIYWLVIRHVGTGFRKSIKDNWRVNFAQAIPLIVMGFFLSAFSLFYLLPAIRGEQSDTLARYGYLGSNGGEIIKTIFTNPRLVINTVLQSAKISYVLRLLVPLCLIPLLNWRRFVIIIPSLFINLLSAPEAQISANYHYDTMIAIGLFWALIFGIRWLEGRPTLLKKFKFDYKLFVNGVLVVFSLITVFLLLGHPVWRDIFPLVKRYQDFEVVSQLRTKIPKSAVILANNKPGSLFGEYPNLYYATELVWQKRGKLPDYVLLDKIDDYAPKISDPVNYFGNLTGKSYRIILETDHLLILERSN